MIVLPGKVGGKLMRRPILPPLPLPLGKPGLRPPPPLSPSLSPAGVEKGGKDTLKCAKVSPKGARAET